MIAAALALMAGPTQAKDLLTSGAWTAFEHRDICGVQTKVANEVATAEIMIKYDRGGSNLYVQLFKSDWQFRSGIDVRANLQFDTVPHWVSGRTIARGTVGNTNAFVEFQVDPSYTADFLELIADSANLNVFWPNGDEPNWQSSMNGSRDVTRVFGQCIKNKGGAIVPPAETGSLGTKPF